MFGVKCITIIWLCVFNGAGIAMLRAGDQPPEKHPGREEFEKRREEWQKLSPEERDAKIKEWRRTNSGPARTEWEKRREQFKNMSPEEREAKRAELKVRLEKRIAELRSKQTNATITPPELRELERREQVLSKFQQAGPGAPSIERPAAREPAAPPPPEK